MRPIDTTDFGLLKVAGVDAQKFLQGQLTTNVAKLEPETFAFAAHCNPQGRIISLFHLMHHQQHYYLFLPQSLLAVATKALKKYAVFFKVTLSDATDEMRHPALSALINKSIQQLQDLQLPILYAQTSEKFLPHELNLPQFNAVDFDKGCYTGQEIIARMHYRGKSKNQLRCYLLDDAATLDFIPGTDISLNDQVCGTIVNTWQHDHQQFLLCVMHENHVMQNKFSIQQQHFQMTLHTNESEQ